MRLLFVANGHGETSIAARIARELAQLVTPAALDLLPIVGTGTGAAPLALVGPRRSLPSEGLVAMVNVRAFARDLRAGFASLLGAQLAFLHQAHPSYDVVVAVGDAYALALALGARLPVVYVGTAKSVSVAPYGPFERFLLQRAARIFVRDEATARHLRARGVKAEAPGNVIADLAREVPPARAGDWLGLVPGSRRTAVAHAVDLGRVVRALAPGSRMSGGLLSIAPTLTASAFAAALAADGWTIATGGEPAPFEARAGEARLVAWTGELGALLAASVAVVGAAGTANEQAAAFGLPVIALDDRSADGWYRMRQRRLLGDALAVVPPQPEAAASAIAALLDDPARLAEMAAAGRARLGPRGGSAAIARAIVKLAA